MRLCVYAFMSLWAIYDIFEPTSIVLLNVDLGLNSNAFLNTQGLLIGTLEEHLMLEGEFSNRINVEISSIVDNLALRIAF